MSSKFIIKIEPHAENDLKIAMNYYENKQVGLGVKFYEKFDTCLSFLETNPFYQIRYKKIIGCFVVPNFPYMIHYYINEDHKMVHIIGLINTYQNPQTSYL